jgi:Cu/Ag efflux protein CusF
MRTLFTIKAGLLALVFASLSTTPTIAQPIEFEGATAGLLQVTAKVDAVDKKDRTITLTGPRGNTVVLQAGPKVKNFDQIKAGDDIVASYYEEIAVVVTQSDGPPPTEQEGFAASEGAYAAPNATEEVDVAAAVARKGAEPGAGAAEVVTIDTTIEAVEYDTRIVTLAGQDGLSRRVKVGPAVELDQLKEGDKVTIQITKAVAVDVQIP